jgi:hypothetical protein
MTPEFAERLILAISGPLAATVFGTVVIGSFVTWTARRLQNRRANFQLRHELATQMSLAANELYFAIRYYLHSKEGHLNEGLALKDVAPVVHEKYRQTRALGYALESRLRAHFLDDDPRANWHSVMDLLEVQYYLAIGQASSDLIKSNAGSSHSSLSEEELVNRERVVATYREKLRKAISEVLSSKLIPDNRMR